MKRIAILLMAISAAAQAQLVTTTTTTTTRTVTLTPEYRQQIQTQLDSNHVAAIQAYLATQKQQMVTTRTTKTNTSFNRLTKLRASIPGRRIDYSFSTDPNTGKAVVSSTGVPAGGDTSGTTSTSTAIGSESYSTGSTITSTSSTCMGTAPSISYMSVTELAPNDAIEIDGCNFGDKAAGQVHLLFAGRDMALENTTWSDRAIYGYMPDVSGVQGTEGRLYVSSASGQSDFRTFTFKPEMVTVVLDIVDKSKGAILWGGNNISHACGTDVTFHPLDEISLFSEDRFFVTHNGAAAGCKGDDSLYTLGKLLSNGYVVDHYQLSLTTSSTDTNVVNAYLNPFNGTPPSINGANPIVSVHFYAAALNYVFYDLTAFARGPKGLNP